MESHNNYQDLDELLEYFDDDISSKRRSEATVNFDDLIEVLDRRDIIDKSVLKSNHELNNQIIKRIADQYVPPSGNNLKNLYAIEREKEDDEKLSRIASLRLSSSNTNYEARDNSSQSNISNDVLTINFDDKKKWVYNEICREIGKKWREFGRGIDIREGEMDELEDQCNRQIKEIVRKMLHILEKEECMNFKRILIKICESLENCRRVDLSRKIQERLAC